MSKHGLLQNHWTLSSLMMRFRANKEHHIIYSVSTTKPRIILHNSREFQSDHISLSELIQLVAQVNQKKVQFLVSQP